MDRAFDLLRERATDNIELAYPDYSPKAHRLEVSTDASGVGMEGMLSQIQKCKETGRKEVKVIAYVSRAFSKAEQRYSTIERELTALRFCVKAFKPFLYNIKFVLNTDHQPLIYLHRMKIMDNRLTRTYEELCEFDYDIEYTPGKENIMADLMSRLPTKIFEQNKNEEEQKHLPVGLEMELEAQVGG